MKSTSLLPAVAAATLFLLPLSRAADPISNPGSDSATATRQSEWIKRFDTNGDGKLDESEKAAAKAAMGEHRAARAAHMRDRMMQRYDKNGDGKLDENEKAAALADLESRPRFIKRFDKDGDGQLNAAEKAEAEAFMRQRWTQMEAKEAAAAQPAPNAPATSSSQ